MSSQALPPSSFGWRRRWLSRFHLVLGLGLALYNLLLFNSIAFRHPWRLDLTEEKLHSLSPATLDKLKLIEAEVRVVMPIFLHASNKEQIGQVEVLKRARRLLDSYMAAQPLIKVSAEVDVVLERDRWLEIRERFGLTEAQVNRLIFYTGEGNQFRQAVAPVDMASFGGSRDPVLDAPVVREFHGEKAITDALTRLIKREESVYFTQDKGELQLEIPPGRSAGVGAIHALKRELATEGLQARGLALAGAREIPDDCKLLIIAGALQGYLPQELEVLHRYLNRGGRLLVALGPGRTGLEDLLSRWGVEVLDGKVERLQVGPEGRLSTNRVWARRFHAFHPVTKAFKNASRFEMLLYAPRPLQGGGREKFLETTALLETESQEASGESHVLAPMERGGEILERGEFKLALSVEQRLPNNPPPDFQRLETRIVVVGASGFLRDDSFVQASHRDFFMNSISWLLGEEEKGTVSGQEWAERTIKMDAAIRRFLFWVPTLLLPGVCLSLGAFIYFLRRA